MSETPAEGQQQEPAAEYTAPATQADLDRIVQDRLSRERAKYADYDDLKTKAGEFDKLSEAQKTEAQKTADKLAKLQAENERLTAIDLKMTVADTKKLPSSLAKNLVGSTQAELEASADELLAALGGGKQEEQKPGYPVIPNEGKTPRTAGGTNGEKFAEFLKSRI